ncbi:hypothetical protein [Deinococcus yavapaiensis]|nr:hypothetical protein [Deinococcus yavapaiensis]
MFDKLNAERRADCESRAQSLAAPLLKQIASPEVRAVRTDVTFVARCGAVLFRDHSQLRTQWARELNARGYRSKGWTKSGGAWYLVTTSGDPRVAGYFAVTNTMYSEVAPDAALILWMGVESQRLK